MAARIKSDQSSLFWVLLCLMMVFFFVDLGTEFMVQIGVTKTQIGGDTADRCFNGLFLIALTVANSGVKRWAEPKDPPSNDPPKVS